MFSQKEDILRNVSLGFNDVWLATLFEISSFEFCRKKVKQVCNDMHDYFWILKTPNDSQRLLTGCFKVSHLHNIVNTL